MYTFADHYITRQQSNSQTRRAKVNSDDRKENAYIPDKISSNIFSAMVIFLHLKPITTAPGFALRFRFPH